ncbi:MAG: zinc-ribbon domain-containing protein [Asticcacaulis sp.]
MILTCPSCTLSYAIDDARLGPQGRTVRCASCKTTWHAEMVQEPIDLPMPAPVEPPVEALKEVKAKKLPLMYRQMLEGQKRHKAVMKQVLIWGALAATFVAMVGAAYMLRIDIVRAFPKLAGAYASAGVPVNPTGLEFISYKAEPTLRGGRFVVSVSAVVKNLRNEETPVPPVRAKVLSADGSVIGESLIPPHGLVVEAGAERTLVFDVADAGNRASSLDLSFDLQALKQLAQYRPSQLAAHPAPVIRQTPLTEIHAPQPTETIPATDDHTAEAATPPQPVTTNTQLALRPALTSADLHP